MFYDRDDLQIMDRMQISKNKKRFYGVMQRNVHCCQSFVLHCIGVTGGPDVLTESIYDRGGIPPPSQTLEKDGEGEGRRGRRKEREKEREGERRKEWEMKEGEGGMERRRSEK